MTNESSIVRRFAVGDRVKLVKGTTLWGQHIDLKDQIGVVTDLVDDGTSLRRVTVHFEGEEPMIGVDEGQFEKAKV